MSDLEQLPPEQRAVLSLLLRQGKGYADVASLLKIDADAVRERAIGALTALGPDDLAGLPAQIHQEVGDYLLSQQSSSETEATRALFGSSPDARQWAESVSGQISGLAAKPLPEVPVARPAAPPTTAKAPVRDPDAPAAGRPAPVRPSGVDPPAGGRQRAGREAAAAGAAAVGAAAAGSVTDAPGRRPPRRPVPETGEPGDGDAAVAGRARSRNRPIGGYLVLAAIAVIIAVIIIVALNSNGGGANNDSAAVTGTSATQSGHSSTATAQPKIEAQINFTPPDASSKALAVADIISQGNLKAFALTAQGLDPTHGFAYAVWLYNSQTDAKLLGFINQEVTANGQAKAIAPLPSDATSFHQIIITKETAQKPTQPGPIVLVGPLGSAG